MKKNYEAPELELIHLSLGKDVLTPSIPEGTQASSGVIEGGNDSSLEGDF